MVNQARGAGTGPAISPGSAGGVDGLGRPFANDCEEESIRRSCYLQCKRVEIARETLQGSSKQLRQASNERSKASGLG